MALNGEFLKEMEEKAKRKAEEEAAKPPKKKKPRKKSNYNYNPNTAGKPNHAVFSKFIVLCLEFCRNVRVF